MPERRDIIIHTDDAPQLIPRDRFLELCPPSRFGLNDRLADLIKRDDRYLERKLTHQPGNYYTLGEFLQYEIPQDASFLVHPLHTIITALGAKAQNPEIPFLQGRGTRGAYGKSCDKDYLSIADLLSSFATLEEARSRTYSHSHDLTVSALATGHLQLASFCRRAIRDLDLDLIVSQMGIDEFAKLWSETAGDFRVSPVLKNGVLILEGWKTYRCEVKNGPTVFTVQAGEFEYKGKIGRTEDLVPVRQIFSVDFVHQPYEYAKEANGSDSRGGTLVAEPERMRRNFYQVDREIRVTGETDFNQRANPIMRYRTLLLDIGFPLEALEPPSLATEKIIRLLRYKTLMPWTWDISQTLGEALDARLSEQYLQAVSPQEWREITQNVYGSIILSPFITAVNLIPNRLLDQLSDANKERIARHAIDYSLSLGRLWRKFAQITPTQADAFLSALPNDVDYNPAHNNGIRLFARAAHAAGIISEEELYDNELLDIADLFSHPADEEIQSIRRIRGLGRQLLQTDRLVTKPYTRELVYQ